MKGVFSLLVGCILMWSISGGAQAGNRCVDIDGKTVCYVDTLPFSNYDSNAEVYLTADVSSATWGIYLGGNDVILDGQGYTLSGNSTEGMYGVMFVGNNVTVKNLTVDNFSWAGVAAASGSDFLIEDCTIKDCGKEGWGMGIYVAAAANGSVKENTVTGQYSFVGMRVFGDNTIIKGNIVNDAKQYGIEVLGDGCDITGNFVSGTLWNDGIELNGVTGAMVDKNVVCGNGWLGIRLGSTHDTICDHNTALNNVSAGIIIQTLGSDQVTDTTVSNNISVFNGIGIDGDPSGPYGNTVVNNVLYGNTSDWTYYVAISAVGTLFVDPVLSSTDCASNTVGYLTCNTPDSLFYGATDGSFIGALPVYGAIRGDEALLEACVAGRELVMATPGYDTPRNNGKSKGQGVQMNMPLIAHVATEYVDSLVICNEEDAEELHSCIVSYFASGGKSSHFGE